MNQTGRIFHIGHNDGCGHPRKPEAKQNPCTERFVLAPDPRTQQSGDDCGRDQSFRGKDQIVKHNIFSCLEFNFSLFKNPRKANTANAVLAFDPCTDCCRTVSGITTPAEHIPSLHR